MMKEYVKPAVKAKNMMAEPLMAAFSMNDEIGDGTQLGKENTNFEEPEMPAKKSVWDD